MAVTRYRSNSPETQIAIIHGNIQKVQIELNSKLDDYKEKLKSELDKSSLTENDKVKMQDYYQAFIGIFASAYVTT